MLLAAPHLMLTLADGSTMEVGSTAARVFHWLRRPDHEPRRPHDPAEPAGDVPGSPGERTHRLRSALHSTLQALPGAASALLRATTRRHRIGEGIGDRLAAIGLDRLQVELARWFPSELPFDATCQIGGVELRRYPARVEACTRVDDPILAAAIDHGYGRLACYTCGANRSGEVLERMLPILTTTRDGLYTVSVVLPPGRSLEELPGPVHPGVELRKLAATQIAALPFRGPLTADAITTHQRLLLQRLAGAGYPTRGSVTLATFPSMTSLPALRRNELWIAID